MPVIATPRLRLRAGCPDDVAASEAAAEVIRLGFAQVRLGTMSAHIDPANRRSRKLLERTGFTLVQRRDRQAPNRRGTTETLVFERYA